MSSFLPGIIFASSLMTFVSFVALPYGQPMTLALMIFTVVLLVAYLAFWRAEKHFDLLSPEEKEVLESYRQDNEETIRFLKALEQNSSSANGYAYQTSAPREQQSLPHYPVPYAVPIEPSANSNEPTGSGIRQ
jgi:ABC-type multidrug transport system fused ATPase/permease subunit